MMNKNVQLSIVSYLDDAATEQIRQFQQAMSDVTGSTASLDSWLPHITLGNGIDATQLELEDVIDEITQASRSVASFSMDISGFGSLDSRPIGVGEASTPYVIFANVVVSQELLELTSRIDEVTSGRSLWYRMSRPYLPHVTLAFRDLTEAGYRNGLDYLSDKNIQLSSTIDHIALVQHFSDSDSELMRIPLDYVA
jgi:2'-5' RNA ligase